MGRIRTKRAGLFWVGLFLLAASPLAAQSPGKLTEFDYFLLGLQVRPDPEAQIVPKNTPTGLRLALGASSSAINDETLLALLPPGLIVAAELVGPGIDTPIQLRGAPGDLLPIPALVSRGFYLVRDLRLIKEDGTTFLRALPDTATVEVIERILITQVTTRPLTLDEIRQKGILFGDDSFHGFEFTVAFRLDTKLVNFTIPAIFDSRQNPIPIRTSASVDIQGPSLPVFNASFVPMMLDFADPGMKEKLEEILPEGGDLSIPGMLVIPGDVGFLNQFFSALLIVSNGAPLGAPLAVSELKAAITLPKGDDQVPGTADDPLVIAKTDTGQAFELPIRGVGADGTTGTGDDTSRFLPGEQGQAEYLLEGKKEGFHPISFDIVGTLEGLPVGPVGIKGKAQGGVLVRNPSFHMTFSAPATVRTGEEFNLYVTVTNVSTSSTANLVRVRLGPGLAGARVIPSEGDDDDDPALETIETIPPQSSEVITFRFISNLTGQVTASYLKFDQDPADHNTGELKFHLGVGERGIPLSPDTLVLPKSVEALPKAVVSAALRVLGLGWSIATAPPGAVPKGVNRIGKQAIVDRVLDLAEAGFRRQLGEPEVNAISNLFFSWAGTTDSGFDQLLRQPSGIGFFNAVGTALGPSAPGSILDFLRDQEDSFTSRPAHILVGVGSGAGAATVTWSFEDGGGRKVDTGSKARDLTNGAFIPLGGAGRGVVFAGELRSKVYAGRFSGTSDGGQFDLSIGLPLSEGIIELHRFSSVAIDKDVKGLLQVDLRTGTPVVTLGVDRDRDGAFELVPGSVQLLRSRGPQLRAATAMGPETLSGADRWGRVVALLFDRAVRKDEANLASSYRVEENVVLSATRQLSGRVVFLFARDPVGNLVTRQATVSGLFDETGEPMSPFEVTTPIGSLLETDAAIVSGRVLTADGKPVTTARILYINTTLAGQVGVSQKEVKADGSYQFDWVARGDGPFYIQALDPQTGGFQELSTSIRTNGEHIVVDLVLLGRGGVRGTVTDGSGPVPEARVAVVSQTDPASFALTETDGNGHYTATNIVVGPVSVKAVKGVFAGVSAGNIPRAGTFTTVDVSLNASGGSVSGRVGELVGDVPVPLVGMDVYYLIPRPHFGEIVVAVVQTDSNGAYRFEGLPIGPFRVLAADRVTGRQKDASGTNAGIDIQNLDILFINTPEQFGIIRGQVRDGADELVDATVFGVGRQVQAAGGIFEFKDVPPGNRSVTAVRPGTNQFASASANVKANEVSNVVIRFPGRGTVKVKVLDTAGVPITGLQVVRLQGSPCAGEIQVTSGPDAVATFENVTVPGGQFKAVRAGDVVEGAATLRADGDEALLTLQFGGFGSVTGKVFEADGFAHGAIVSLGARKFDVNLCSLIYDSRAAQVRADTKGEFRFENVPVGTFTVSARSGITESEASAKDVLIKHGDSKNFVFTLKPNVAGKLSGRVLLPTGGIPAGAGVSVTASSGGRPDVTVVTQADGSYEFAKIFPPGGYTLTASDPITGALAQQMVSLQKEQDLVVDLRLLGRGAVEVKVLDGGGIVVTDAFVELKASRFPFDQAAGAIRPSDEGVIRFERISEGDFSVTASDRLGRGGRASGSVAEEGATAQVVVSLTVTGTVKGVVKSPDGSLAIPNAEVRLRQGTTGRLLGSTVSSSDPAPDKLGTFEFQYVPAGTVLATATDPLTGRLGEASGRIDNQDQVLSLAIQLLGLGRITGKVTNGPDGQVGAKVDLKSTTGLQNAQANLEATATTGTGGGFVFEGVPVGSFTLKATVPGLQLTGTTTGSIDGDGDDKRADIALEASGSVSGTLFRADGVTTIPGAEITLRTRRGALRGQSSLSGAYHFDFVLTGDVTATAEHTASGDAGIADGTVVESEDLPLDVVFNGTGTIDGTAFESDGLTALTEGTVYLSRPAPFARSEAASVGVNGKFQFQRIPVGDFSLTLVPKNSPLRGTFAGTIENDGDAVQVPIRLADSGAVFGSIVREDGTTEVPRAAIQVSGPGFSLSDLADAHGFFRIDGIPKAKFTVRVEDVISGGLALASGEVKQNGDEIDLGTVKLDESPIAVESITPDATTPIQPDGTIVVRFTDRVNPNSLPGRVNVRQGTKLVGIDTELSSDGLVLTIRPVVAFPPNASVNLVLSRSISDVLGRPLGQDVEATITISGAVVVGTVTALNNPIQDATVKLTAGTVLKETTTDAAGRYRFDDLPFTQGSTEIVTVEATGAGGERGRNSGTFANFGKITLNMQLTATGSVTGTVVEADGLTVVAGAEVNINQFLSGFPTTVLTNENGVYFFDFVPAGNIFTINVTKPSTGDRGRATGSVSAPGEMVFVNVKLNGLGQVEVIVRDANNNLASDAEVTVFSQTQFGGSQELTTGSDGRVLFERVLAGNFFVQAVGPTGLRASKNGSVGVNGFTSVALQLQPSGTLRGMVRLSDGTTAVANANVQLSGPVFQQMTSESDGSFRFLDVPVGTYTLSAFLSGELRARVSGIALKQNEDLTRNLIFVPRGIVRGQVVKDADDSPVANVTVFVQGTHAFMQNFGSDRTDAQGFYEVTKVPQGAFAATAALDSEQLRGETTGRVDQEAEIVTANVRLLNNGISLPATRFDANNMPFDIRGDGSIGFGRGFTTPGAFLLDVISGGTPFRFPTATTGTVEEDGREIVTLTRPLAGLDVKRKVFVPREGYFARYLEILANPTGAPITVDVRVSTKMSVGFSNPFIVATSNGNFSIDVPDGDNPDRWFIFDDTNPEDPFQVGGLPSFAYVFDGPGAEVRAGAASFDFFSRELTYEWKAVTVPANATIILSHLGAQQLTRAAAQASAERLVQLPPELLAGLNQVEAGQVRNFVVPADGSSSLSPLPSLNGTVTGRLVRGESATPLASTRVQFKSKNVFFGRTHSFFTQADGTFVFRSSFNNFGSSVAIPIDDFTLDATDPATQIRLQPAGSFSGPFDGNLSLAGIATASSFFSGFPPARAIDGNLSTSWFTASGDAVNRGKTPFLDVTLPSDSTVRAVNVRGNREFADNFDFFRARVDIFDNLDQLVFTIETDLPAPTRDVDLSVPNLENVRRVRFTGLADEGADPGLSELAVIGTAALTNIANVDFVFPGSGLVTGTVTRPNAAFVQSARVELSMAGSSLRTAFTNGQGQYSFPSVAVGRTFSLRAFHPLQPVVFRDVVDLILEHEGDSLNVDFAMPALATVAVKVVAADGTTPIPNIFVILRSQLINTGVTTDASGVARFNNIPEGPFTVEAAPGRFVIVEGVVTAGDDGKTVNVTIVQPPAGIVKGRLFASDGETPLPFASVTFIDKETGFFLTSTSTDQIGFYESPTFRPGHPGFTAVAQWEDVSAEASGDFTAEGDVLTIDFTLPVSVITGQVFFADGVTPVAFANVFATQWNPSLGQRRSYFNQLSDPDGHFRLVGVREGDFKLIAQHSNSGLFVEVRDVLPSVTIPFSRDVLLPPSGTVTATVVDEDAGDAVVTSAWVALSSERLSFMRLEATVDGIFSFERVPVGWFLVHGGDCTLFSGDGDFLVCRRTSKPLRRSVAQEGAVTEVTLALPKTGTVSGTVFLRGDPVAFAGVGIENFAVTGLLDGESYSTRTDEFGFFERTGVPVGTVHVTGFWSDPSTEETLVGSEDVTVEAGATTTVDVNVGTESRFAPFFYSGDFLFDLRCSGYLEGGGTSGLSDAYRDSYLLDVNSHRFPCFSSNRRANTEVEFGLASLQDLEIARLVFVPSQGGYARYLEVVTNPGSQDVTAEVRVTGTLGGFESTAVVVSPQDTENHYAVTQAQFCCRPALAHVFGGPGADVAVSAVDFENGEAEFSYRWHVTVPAGQTIILMHFAVQRELNDTAAAQAQAEALVNLTDENVLAEMDAAERAQVVNFRIPQ